MLTAADLAAMRAVQEEVMPTSCTVRAPGTATSDGAGGTTRGDPTDTTTICRVTRASRTQPVTDVLAARIGELVLYQLRLPHGTTVENDYQIIVGTQTFEVLAVEIGLSYATALTVYCVEVL